MDEDDALWARFVEGDEKAWTALCRRHWKRVRWFFLNKVGDEADDLTQTTFRRLHEGRGRIQRPGAIRAFVLGIARNVLFEFYRQKKRDERVELGEVSVAELGMGASSVLCRRAEQRVMLEALRNLSLDHQIVLELFYWEDLTDREIAEVLEVGVNTVRSRVARGRAHLKKLLDHFEEHDPLPSTSADLEKWARNVRQQLDDEPEPA